MTDSKPEYFRMLRATWDKTEGNRLAEAVEVQDGDVSGWFGWLRLIWLDAERAATADLTRPLLFVQLVNPDTGEDAGPMLIDGWHRLHRARAEGVTILPVKVLSKDDSAKVLVGWL